MKKNKKKGFTLVELLAVIVVLAIILVIAVPKILDVIKSSRENSIISSAKLIARNAEQKRLANEVLGENVESYNCSDVADLNSTDYANCTVTFDSDGNAVVNITGSGKFKNMNVCNATKDNVSVTEEECEDIEEPLVYLSPNWKDIVYEAIGNEITASETSNTLFDINPTPLYGISNESTMLQISCNPSYVGQIDFYTTKNVPSGITSNSYVDVSLSNDNTVKAYYKENEMLGEGFCSESLYNIYIVGDGIISFPEDSTELFSELRGVKTINFNNSVDTSNVIYMSVMFAECTSLEELDLSHIDTSNVTDMGYMFYHCQSLQELDLSHIDTSKVENMSGMFCWCSTLTSLDLSNFDTSKVTDMSDMFGGCESLEELDLSNFDTSKVTGMYGMFCGANPLASENSNFDAIDNDDIYTCDA